MNKSIITTGTLLEKIDKPLFHYLIIAIVCCFSFFINNQVIPADLMESRNLATAQEMVRNDSYLIPTMNGELRLEKPPLPTWIAAGVEHIAPGNLVVQRYAAGLAATLMVMFLYLLVVKLTRSRKTALLAALVLATSLNVILMGRTATWDIYCHSFMLGAIYFLVLALSGEGAQWRNFLFSGMLMGISFLSKGPVSFYALLLSFIIAYAISYKPSLKNKVWPLISMVALCLLIAFWWTIYLLLTHPEMMLQVAHKESSSWIDHNVRPWYYYWQFPAEAGIWALFLVTALIYFAFRNRHTFKQVYGFAFTWFVSSLVLLSVIPEKKARYLLPILIPGAFLVGLYIYHCIKGLSASWEKWIFRINATLIAIIFIAIPPVLYKMFYENGNISLGALLLSIVLGWGIGAGIFHSIYRKKEIRADKVFFCIILGMMMIEGVCLKSIGSVFINSERNSIRLLRQNTEVQGTPFFYNQDEFLRMELVYEANQTIRKMDVSDDAQIYESVPFVFVSGQPIDSIFAKKENIVITNIGTFDNNWRTTGHRRYNKDLVRHVAIIRNNPQPNIVNE